MPLLITPARRGKPVSFILALIATLVCFILLAVSLVPRLNAAVAQSPATQKIWTKAPTW